MKLISPFLLGLVLTAFSASCRYSDPVKKVDTNDGEVPPASVSKVIYPPAPGSFVGLVKNAQASIVRISSTNSVGGHSPLALAPLGGSHNTRLLATGFVFNKKGHVLTSARAIQGADALTIGLTNGQTFPGKIVGIHKNLDIAVLHAPGLAAPPLSLGTNVDLVVGQWVAAMGNPLGHEAVLTTGVLSSTQLYTEQEFLRQPEARVLLLTDALIDETNVGGPLLSMAGQVIGLNIQLPGSGRNGYAVPVDLIRSVLPQLLAGDSPGKAYVGVFVLPITEEIRSKTELSADLQGAYVSQIVSGSPAEQAGLTPGDIILSFDGKSVDHKNLPWIAGLAKPGLAVPLEVWRSQKLELMLTPAKQPR